MRFIHIGDLHIGKRVNDFSMIENQKYVFGQIVEYAQNNTIDGVLISGDIYDKPIPSLEAIEVFENFIEEFVNLKLPVYIVSGNHDSVERLSAFSNLMKKSNIFISKNYPPEFKPIKNGICDIWLLPFIRPADVRKFFPNIEIGNYHQAVENVIKTLKLNKKRVNILVAHQFVTCNGNSPEKSDSEIHSLGTLDNVDCSVFEGFDYVALGHIHKPQNMGRKNIRYCGSPLKYSFSEVNQKKSLTVLNIDKDDFSIEEIPFNALRDMKEIKGDIETLLKSDYDESYMHITLTDNEVIDAKRKLENVFPNIMKLDFERFNNPEIATNIKNLTKKSVIEHFETFFKKQSARDITEQEREIIFEFLKGEE